MVLEMVPNQVATTTREATLNPAAATKMTTKVTASFQEKLSLEGQLISLPSPLLPFFFTLLSILINTTFPSQIIHCQDNLIKTVQNQTNLLSLLMLEIFQLELMNSFK